MILRKNSDHVASGLYSESSASGLDQRSRKYFALLFISSVWFNNQILIKNSTSLKYANNIKIKAPGDSI